MDQQVNNINLTDLLRTTFENSEIFCSIMTENDYPQSTGNPFMVYRGSSRSILKLTVNQSQKDYLFNKKTWDDAVFIEILSSSGVFISRHQNFNILSSSLILDYTFHIHDMDQFEANLTKYAEELFNKQFTSALESKLTED